MKMRILFLILFLIGFIAGAWGCGGDAVTNPPPPVTPIPPTVTPVVTPVHRGPTPTPNHCPNFKFCNGGPAPV